VEQDHSSPVAGGDRVGTLTKSSSIARGRAEIGSHIPAARGCPDVRPCRRFADMERFVGCKGNVQFLADDNFPRSLARLSAEVSEALITLKLITKPVSVTAAALDYAKLSDRRLERRALRRRSVKGRWRPTRTEAGLRRGHLDWPPLLRSAASALSGGVFAALAVLRRRSMPR
jgi:hypothetical protein